MATHRTEQHVHLSFCGVLAEAHQHMKRGSRIQVCLRVRRSDDRYAMIDEARGQIANLFAKCAYPTWLFGGSTVPQLKISTAARRAARNAGDFEF